MLAGPLTDAQILYKPSKELLKFIKTLKGEQCDGMPCGVANIANNTYKKPSQKEGVETIRSYADYPTILKPSDVEYLNSLNLSELSADEKHEPAEIIETRPNDKLLNFDDLKWLHEYVEKHNASAAAESDCVYFHTMFQGTQIILPKNQEIERSEELEARCVKLRNQQRNREYKLMTKNVDNARQHHPEDTVSFQMKQMNQQLIAVFQFVVSVLTGFVFGFLGIELMLGSLDFGFRLLLGIICALIVALAELYFLAKKLNEDVSDVYQPTAITTNHHNSKVKRE